MERAPAQSNYLLFSDVHLGADLVQHVRPWTVERLKQVATIDRELAAMLEWYRERSDPEHPWTLVIAGDLVDFVGMAIAPRPEAALELNEDERAHGLGSALEHAVLKMRAVARRHTLVFDSLARFVAEGHRLVLVRGNHDVDFHWEAAREAFVEALVERHASAGRNVSHSDFGARIEFYPWFYYVEGLLYVEHGHQFDAMCNYAHLLAPLSPADPSRIHWSFSDLLLRYIVRPTPGLSTEGHDKRSLVDYLRFAWSMGLVGSMRLGYRYVHTVVRAIRMGRAMLGGAAHAVVREHERRMQELADRTRIRIEHLRELASLWPTPVTGGALRVLRSVFIDQVAFAALGTLVVAALFWFLSYGVAVPLAAIVVAAWACYAVWSTRQRIRDIDPTQSMRGAAVKIARLFPSRFVVMGHTHDPRVEPVDEQTTYVNLGSWGTDELDAPGEEAPRTHLVLRWIEGQLHAEFCRWDSVNGPRAEPVLVPVKPSS